MTRLVHDVYCLSQNVMADASCVKLERQAGPKHRGPSRRCQALHHSRMCEHGLRLHGTAGFRAATHRMALASQSLSRLVVRRAQYHGRVARHARGSARDGTRLMIWESTNTTFHVVEYWLRRAFAPEGSACKAVSLVRGPRGEGRGSACATTVTCACCGTTTTCACCCTSGALGQLRAGDSSHRHDTS